MCGFPRSSLTRTTLDVDEASAALAGKELQAVYNAITDVWLRLELVERALREAEPRPHLRAACPRAGAPGAG